MTDRQKKTDNHNPAAKLALRKYFLDKYHADTPPDVMDCCQGGGVIWKEICKTYDVASYWGLDLKPKKGRLKLDSVRVLQQPGWPQNVVDVDTYGSPWKHWLAMLPNVTQPTTVFLTIGHVQSAFVGTPREIIDILGLRQIAHCLPLTISGKLWDLALSHLLTTGCESVKLIEAVESVSNGNASYIGVRLEPIKTKGSESLPPSRSKHKQVERKPAHV